MRGLKGGSGHLPLNLSVGQLTNRVLPSVPHQSVAAMVGLSFPPHVAPSGHAVHSLPDSLRAV